MRVRIEDDGTRPYATKFTDVETGEAIGWVTSATIHFVAGKRAPTATLTVTPPEVDVIAEADIKYACPCCGRESVQPPISGDMIKGDGRSAGRSMVDLIPDMPELSGGVQ